MEEAWGLQISRVRPLAWGWGSLFSVRDSPVLSAHLELAAPSPAGNLGGGGAGRALPGPPELWAPPGVWVSPPVWGDPQLWGSRCPWGRGTTLTCTHMDTHTHTQTHMEAPGPTLPGAHSLGGAGVQEDRPPQPLALGRGRFQGASLLGPPTPLGFPQELGLAGRGPRAPGHSSVFLVQTHRPPTIPRHVLFNNLSLLNYLLAFATSPPPPSPPLSPSAPPTKAENGNDNNKDETSVYL